MGTIDERRRVAFDEMAEPYDAARPGYPEALVRDVLERTGARRVVEVGAGTGKATTVLARAGCEVVAVEPGAKLAEVLRRRVAAFPGVAIAVTKFEDWSPGERPFDLLVAAQSFHWVDPAVRYAKAARVATHLAVLANAHHIIDAGVRAEFDEAYTRWTGGGDGNVEARNEVEITRRKWTEGIDSSGLYGSVHVAAVPWEATYSTREYLALLDTYSDHATLEAPTRRGLYEAIAAAIDRHGGRLVVPYVAMAFVARANTDPTPPPDAVAEEMKRFQGTWEQIGYERDGVSEPVDAEQGWRPRVTFSGDTFVVTLADGSIPIAGNFRIDPTRSPKTVDWMDTIGEDAGKTLPAIYSLEGDRFVFCAASPGDERPTEFRTRPGQVLRVSRRVKA